MQFYQVFLVYFIKFSVSIKISLVSVVFRLSDDVYGKPAGQNTWHTACSPISDRNDDEKYWKCLLVTIFHRSQKMSVDKIHIVAGSNFTFHCQMVTLLIYVCRQVMCERCVKLTTTTMKSADSYRISKNECAVCIHLAIDRLLPYLLSSPPLIHKRK